MKSREYALNVAIPALNEEKIRGYTRSALNPSMSLDCRTIAQTIEDNTDYTCTVCGGSIYVKLF